MDTQNTEWSFNELHLELEEIKYPKDGSDKAMNSLT
jgi:hypothetical protein